MNDFLGSRRNATLITWLFLLIFCGAIGFGWWSLVTASLQSTWAKAVALVFVLGLTLGAAFFARQIGQMRAAAKLAGQTWRWYHGWKPWLFLAVISALGTLNTAFVLLESRSILRDDVQNVRNRASNLRVASDRDLTPAGFNEKEATVRGHLTNLRNEIINDRTDGKHCGVGREARDIIGQMRSILPNFREISGSGPINPCDRIKAERMYQPYEEMAWSLLRADRQFQQNKGPEKLALRDAIQRHQKEMDQPLRELETAASGFGPAAGIDKRALLSARDNYNADLKQYLGLIGPAAASESELELVSHLQSDQVDSYAATLRLIYDRFLNYKTIFYLIIALGLDFAVIWLITLLNERFGSRSRRRQDGVSDHPSWSGPFAKDPKFLWVNPPWAGKES